MLLMTADYRDVLVCFSDKMGNRIDSMLSMLLVAFSEDTWTDRVRFAIGRYTETKFYDQ